MKGRRLYDKRLDIAFVEFFLFYMQFLSEAFA